MLLVLFAVSGIKAQVVNYAIELEDNGYVNCGLLPDLDGKSSFTVQMWIKPIQWNEGAKLLSRGDGLKISLGTPGVVDVTLGDDTYKINNVPVDSWSLLSLRVNNGIVYVNDIRKNPVAQPLGISSGNDPLILGGGYYGLIDEVRIWGISLPEDFNRFEHTTLNNYNPYWDDLLVYFKMDQELCDNLVDYKGIYSKDELFNHHGIFSESGVKRVVADNPLLPYLINSAYTANERFYDRAIPRQQYLFANDLIILGIQSYPDGHVKYCTPNCHATLQGTATRLAEWEEREGVMSFDGEGSLDCGVECMNVGNRPYTFESWIYIDEWVEGAYIIRKETEDGLNGFSISLGDQSKSEIIVKVNGKKFSNIRNTKVGTWFHLGIVAENGGTTRETFVFVFNGSNVTFCSSSSDDSTDPYASGNEECHAIIGENFKGKLDNLAVWQMAIGRGDFANHMKSMPMPAINKEVTSSLLQAANTLLTFDNPEAPGYDSYSQDHWKDIMLAAYEGHRGYQVRISVKSHNGWETTLWNAEKRKIFAEDLARLSEGYDGVELDLEWIYSTQTQLGLLSDEIRAALPEDKSLMISCHNVAYKFPLDKMDNCDGFTFQQYGPQKDHSYYSTFVNYTNTFINYGFPKEKIMCSYATTTSEGHINGSRPSNAPPIRGVRDGFMDGDDFVPNEEVDFGTVGGYTYYFDGPLQTYKRAKFVTDNRLAGIFYWDMGNDVRPEHPYNLAKWSTYGLNHNVDTLITHVEIHHFDAAINDIVADKNEKLTLAAQTDDNTTLILNLSPVADVEVVKIYNLSGLCIATVRNRSSVDISSLISGHYIVEAVTDDGRRATSRFFKR